MKFTVAYYLFLLYATVILKPLIPLAEDGIEHCFAEAYHVATVHARYGNNHVEKEMADAGNDNKNNRDQNTVKSEETTTPHITTTTFQYAYFAFTISKYFSVFTLHKIPAVFVGKHIPPPKNKYFI